MDASDCNCTALAVIQDDVAPLSQGSIFGMLLTIHFCLLTQPSGSLLFKDSAGNAWRINPISCLTEGLFIASFVFKTVIPPWWRNIRSRPWHEKHAIGISEMAAALMLLRGATTDDDHDRIQGLMAASEQEDEENGIGELNDDKHGRLVERFHGLLGSDIIAHRQRRIDLVTIVSVVTIAIKAMSLREAGVLQASTTAWVLGFLAVQSLLFMLHRPQPREFRLDLLMAHLRDGKRWSSIFQDRRYIVVMHMVYSVYIGLDFTHLQFLSDEHRQMMLAFTILSSLVGLDLGKRLWKWHPGGDKDSGLGCGPHDSMLVVTLVSSRIVQFILSETGLGGWQTFSLWGVIFGHATVLMERLFRNKYAATGSPILARFIGPLLLLWTLCEGLVVVYPPNVTKPCWTDWLG